MIHDKFALIETAAERHNSDAALALRFINDTLNRAFERQSIYCLKLGGADPAERVAEALAAWIAESAPRRFAEMTGTRYAVTGVDDSADGMERLRNQDEFILLAYPNADSTPAELGEQWLADIDSAALAEDSDFAGIESAVRQYVAEATESGYLAHKLAEAARIEAEAKLAAERGDFDAPDFEPGIAFRLYVRDNAPESDQ